MKGHKQSSGCVGVTGLTDLKKKLMMTTCHKSMAVMRFLMGSHNPTSEKNLRCKY
jgi:hypothetical protein